MSEMCCTQKMTPKSPSVHLHTTLSDHLRN